MRSRTTSRFRKLLKSLPEEVQKQAQKPYRQFELDPRYKSLNFKQVYPSLPIYSVRITKDYRAVGKCDKNGMLWFWIGSHADYDKLLENF